jgi:ABC-type Fe3+ transport system permease subunit
VALDTLGCSLAAARYDFGRAARATAERLGGPPESVLVGSRVRVAVLAIMACAIFQPYGILAKAAVSSAWAQPLTWDNLTLSNFTFTFFEYSATQPAILNTLELGVMTACVGAGLVALLFYITNRRLVVGAWCFIFIFIGVICELSASIILFTPSTKVMSVVIFDLIAVLGLVMLFMTFATVGLVQPVLGRDFLGTRE